MFRRVQCKPALRLALTAFFLLQALAAARSSAQLVSEASDSQTDKNSAAAGARRIHQELALTGDQHWADTAIDVKAGERIQVSAKGTLRCAEAPQENGPEGLPRGFRDLLRILPLNQAGRGALIGRIGDADIDRKSTRLNSSHD